MQEIIFKSKYAQLPTTLLADDLLGISEVEALGLLGRMRLIEQLGDELGEWRSISDDQQCVESFIDRIELHSALCLALPKDRDAYSWWLAHTGWRPFPMLGLGISAQVVLFLQMSVPSLGTDRDHFSEWIASSVRAINAALEAFFSSSESSVIWRNLVALNSIVSLVLSGISRQRL